MRVDRITCKCTHVLHHHIFFFVLFSTVSVLMLLSLLGLIPNQTIGFYCNDPKISHKFTGDTISMALLLAITILLPLLVVSTSGFFLNVNLKKKRV